MDASPREPVREDSRGKRASRAGSGAGSGPGINRSSVLGAALAGAAFVGAILLIVADLSTLIEIKVLTVSKDSISGGSHHSYALLILGIFALPMAYGATRGGSRPAMAALATLLSIWIYNDFFWALVLLSHGNKRPITSALNNLQGEFLINYNLIAAGALLACLPPIIVYILLQRQFVAGLTLGSTKG